MKTNNLLANVYFLIYYKTLLERYTNTYITKKKNVIKMSTFDFHEFVKVYENRK